MDNPEWLTWITPSLAACSYPDSDNALVELASEGVSLLINLHTRTNGAPRPARHGITELHLPTRDFTAPTLDQIERGIAALRQAVSDGRRAAVHCGAGLGRTGTLVACYLVASGTSASEAIKAVRRARPGSIETRGQETLVHRYENSLRRAGGV